MSEGLCSESSRIPKLRDYLAEAILHRLTAMQSCIEASKTEEDAAAIKSMRVWARRSRAALECDKDLFPRKEIGKLEASLKATASALGVARDNDVLVSNLEKRKTGLPESQHSGINEMVEELKAQRIEDKKSALIAIKKLERRNPMERFRSLAQASKT